MNSKEYWNSRAMKRLTSAERKANEHINRINKIYLKANLNIQKQIANIYKNYSNETGIDVDTLKELLSKKETDAFWKTMEGKGLKQYVKSNYKSRITRLEQIQAQLYAQAKNVYDEELQTSTELYKDIINDSYYKTIYDTAIGTGYDFSFNKIDERTFETILNENWLGSNYSQRIWKNTDIVADKISEIIGGSLISGQPMQNAINELINIFGVGRYYAERLVRTETNHFNSEAEALAYEELNVKKYVFVATLDSKTSEICQEHDHKIYELDKRQPGENYPPLHPNCRSTVRAYLGKEEESLLKRRAVNPITGKVELIDNISYKEWKNKYVPTFGKKNSFDGKEQIYTKKEIEDIAAKTENIIDSHTNINSKWSGKIVIDNDGPSAKLWSCDIRTPNITSAQEIIHEQLHARSISYYDGNIYSSYKNIEEATVELFTEEICKKEKIDINHKAFDDLVGNLRKINSIVSISKDEYDFAKQLFEIPVTDRLDFLEKRIYDYVKTRTIGEAQDLNKLMEVLYDT